MFRNEKKTLSFFFLWFFIGIFITNYSAQAALTEEQCKAENSNASCVSGFFGGRGINCPNNQVDYGPCETPRDSYCCGPKKEKPTDEKSCKEASSSAKCATECEAPFSSFGKCSDAEFCCIDVGTKPKLSKEQCEAISQNSGCMNVPGPNDCPDDYSYIGLCEDLNSCCQPPNDPPNPTVNPGTSSFNYVPLEQIPGSSRGEQVDFPGYLESLYKFVLWGVGISGVLMIIIGGFMYITAAGNTGRASAGKDVIQNAILGLLVALFTWLFLFTINPDLVRIDLGLLSAWKTSTGGNLSYGSYASGPVPPGYNGDPNAGSEVCKTRQKVAPSSCSLATDTLNKFMDCLENSDSDLDWHISSVTSNAVGGDLEASKGCCAGGSSRSKGLCPHGGGSCHHGCKSGLQKGYSYAIDIPITGGESRLCPLAKGIDSCLRSTIGSGGRYEFFGPRKTGMCDNASLYRVLRDGGQPGHEDHFHVGVSCGSAYTIP